MAPDFGRSALVVIDVQADFLDGSMPVAGTSEVLPRLAELVRAFRAAQRPIAHVIRLYERGSSGGDAVRRVDIEAGAFVVVPGTPGADIPEVLLPGGSAVVLRPEALLRGGGGSVGALRR